MILLIDLVYVLLIVEYWLVFKKANGNGWEILIPFYGEYAKYKIANKEKLFWQLLICVTITFFIAILLWIITMITCSHSNGCGCPLSIVAYGIFAYILTLVYFFIFHTIRCINTAKKFGQDVVFGLGLAFLEPIFAGLLAFNSDYIYQSNRNDTTQTKEHGFEEYFNVENDINNNYGY